MALHWSVEILAQSWDPAISERVVDNLRRINPQADEILARFHDRGLALINLLGFSPISLEKINREPELLSWLSDHDVQKSREFQRDQRRTGGGDSSPSVDLQFKELRRWKSGELLRIAYREVSGLAGCIETTRDITWVAERCVSQVYEALSASLSTRWGQPKTGFGVLAMGKFGGSELNYSSDIDLIFFYDQDDFLSPRFTYREFFTRLAEKFVDVFLVTANPLFRIDLRLRPEGSAGPLVRSFASIENYYAGYGETWERMALIKARGICGDGELLYEFGQRLQPFIYPRLVSADLLDEIADIKMRIERDLVGGENLHRNVKLGFGGIREIEFIVQSLQLLHGARNAFLQERNTLKTLNALEQLEILPRPEVAALGEAYVFLRNIEHRLQIIQEQQTHTLPVAPEARWVVARSLGFPSVEKFDQELAACTGRVRAIFARLFQGRSMEVPNERSLAFFQAPELAEKGLATLRSGPSNVHVAPRTRLLFAKLEPELLRWLKNTVEPDAVLNRFIRFVEGYGIRGLLFETLLANPRLLELLIKLFDSSAVFSDIVIRRPQLIEELTRGDSLGRSFGAQHFLQGLRRNEEGLDPLDWVRVYRRGEMVRMVLRDVLGFASPEELQLEMSQLAEACLCHCLKLIPGSDQLTLIALGKFGGRELLYGADLDVVFVGHNVEAAGKLIEAMAIKTPEGRVFSLDARLRPEGQSGSLVISLESYAEYFRRRAQLWERQALTKARVVAGPQAEEVAALIERVWREAGHRADLRESILGMYRRVVKERGKGADFTQFKTGKGGLMAIEFIVQYLQMRDGIREQNTLKALKEISISNENRQGLGETYQLLRKIESTLRKVDNVSVSQIPAGAAEQEKLARRLGFNHREAFAQEVRSSRARVEKILEEVFQEA